MTVTAAHRRSLPPSKFGLPKQKKYLLDTAGRARNAKSRASEMEHKGVISHRQEETIDSRADRALARMKRAHAGR